MRAIYLAHPYGGTDANREAAQAWGAALVLRGYCVIAPWLWLTRELSEEHREAGLAANFEAIARCDALLAVGHWRTPGVIAEVRVARRLGVRVLDRVGPNSASPSQWRSADWDDLAD